jgi:hypothetical protein
VRRNAIRILRRRELREGTMDSALRARLIELQIAVEEPGAVGMYILEEARIRGIKTKMQYGAEKGGHDLSEDGGVEEECNQAALSGPHMVV